MPPDYTHTFLDAQGNAAADVTIVYPGGGNTGKIMLDLSKIPAGEERSQALIEYNNLAAALSFNADIHPEAGKIEIYTGSRSPDGLMLFISSNMQERGIIKPGESHRFIDALTQHEQQTAVAYTMPESQPMKNAMDQVYASGAKDDFTRSGGVYSNKSKHATGSKETLPNLGGDPAKGIV